MIDSSGLWYWLSLGVLILIGYLLPGYVALSFFRLTGLTRLDKIALSLALSLVIIPYILVSIGNVFHVWPTFTWVLFITGALALVRIIAGRRGWLVNAPSFQVEARVKRVEYYSAAALILIFACVTSLPRLDLIVHGNAGGVILTSDEFWHLAHVITLTNSGIPPRHYLFPDLEMIYYYWSWIPPVTVINQTLVQVSLARMMALHEWLQTGVFAWMVYVLLRLNVRKTSARLMGLAFLTFVGGFDFFATMTVARNEWWQKAVPWLVSPNQISSFVTLNLWVQQHLAGALAFVLGLLVWKHVQASPLIRGALLGSLAAYLLGASAFVYMTAMLALLIVLVLNFKHLFNRPFILGAAAFLVFAALGGWRQLLVTLSHPGQIVWSDLRVPLAETFLGTTAPGWINFDRVVTLIGLPLLVGWIMLIELGLLFVLYLVWVAHFKWRDSSPWDRLLLLLPLTSILLIFLLKDQEGGNNFAMRTIIPAQILMIVAVAQLLDRFEWSQLARWQRLALGYGLGIILMAQSISGLIDLNVLSRDSLGGVLRAAANVEVAGLPVIAKYDWPEAFAYIPWLNQNTPGNALIVEETAPEPLADRDRNKYFRLLERMRFMLPKEASQLLLSNFDQQSLLLKPWEAFVATSQTTALFDLVKRSSYLALVQPPVYWVQRPTRPCDRGEQVYADNFVVICHVDLTASPP